MRWIGKGLAIAAATGALVGGAAAADPKPAIWSGGACGSADDLYFCLNFTPADSDQKTVSQFTVTYPGAGTALVTWSGSVFCSLTPSTPDGSGKMSSLYEYYVYFNLKGDNSPYVHNEPGSAALGEKSVMQFRAADGDAKRNVYRLDASRVDMKPLTLTRVFKISKSGKATYKAISFADFRSGLTSAFCNVNGGNFTVSYVPK